MDNLLSRNEAFAVLEEHGCPFEELPTNRDVLHWCVTHRDELPYSPVEIMRAFFPHNPQNVKGIL